MPSHAERLANTRAPLVKKSTLENILYDGNAYEPWGNGPRFWFAGRPIHRPPYALFRRRGDNLPIEHTSQCVLGYFNYPAVTKYREKKLKPLLHPSGGVDTVGTRLSEKRLSQITPNEWFQDPYIVCILLSIAQLQQRLLQVPRSTIHKSRLLVTKFPDAEYIHLYEAHFASDLLKSLEDQWNTTDHIIWPIIRHQKISYRPFDTFQQRLLAELLAPEKRSCRATSDMVDDDSPVLVGSPMKRHHEDEGDEADEARAVKRKL